MDRFVWIPGNGIDSAALKRLQMHLRRPTTPMGEAWFMGVERRMFNELLGDLQAIGPFELQNPLEEIVTGASSFGRMDEWEQWYHYLLAQLLPRGHEHYVEYLLEFLVSGFVATYPSGTEQAPYGRFKEDVVLTLGKAIMDASCWQGTNIRIGTMLHRSDNCPAKVWCWWDASGDFSASMFFCLKYLPPTLVSEWLASALSIPSPHWRAQLIVWLVGASECLQSGCWPSDFKERARPSVSWAWSHCLDSGLLGTDGHESKSFIPAENREAALRTVRRHITEDVYLEWLASMSAFPYLEAELAEIPTTFESIYLSGAQT